MPRSAEPGEGEDSATPVGRGGVAAPREPGHPPVSFEETQPGRGAPSGLEDTQPRHDPVERDASTDHTPIEAPPAPVHEPTLRQDPLVGQRVGHYELRNRLGVGGMSVVYEAVEPLIGKRVAVKVLRPELSAEPRLVERLLAEARAVNAIQHRGIIDIYAFGTLNDGRPYVVMEYLEGQPLDEWLRAKGSVSPVEVLSHLVELLGALAAAHAAGVVHCDLKPGNVFLVHQSDGTRYVKVLDFGLSWRRVAGGALRAKGLEGLAAGTPDFMAPEQVRGEAPTPATDLYAVGVIAYTLFTGQRLFRGDGAEVMRQHASQPPRPMRQLQPALSAELDALVLSLLAKRPQDRPASAELVRQEFDRLRRVLELEALRRSEGSGTEAPPGPRSSTEPAPGAAQRLSSLLEAPHAVVPAEGSSIPTARLRSDGQGPGDGSPQAGERASPRRRTDGKGALIDAAGLRGDAPSSPRRRTDGRGVIVAGAERKSAGEEHPFPRRRTDGQEPVVLPPTDPRVAHSRAFAPSPELEEERVPVHPRASPPSAGGAASPQASARVPAPWSEVTPLAWEPGTSTELIRPAGFSPPEPGEDETVRAPDAALEPLLPRWAWGLILLALLGGLLLWWSTSPTDDRPRLPEGDRRLLDFDRGSHPLR